MAKQGDHGIAWTEQTWNPIRGCTRVSEGCRACYAEKVAARFSGPGQPYEGLAKITPAGARWTGEVRFIEEHLRDPLRWRKPRTVFVNSMSDLFHEKLPDAQIDAVFAVMALAPQHTFQVLTKRAERLREYCRRRYLPGALNDARILHDLGGDTIPVWPLPNVWLGVSVEDQKTADQRIPFLLQAPAATRFVSYEPALGPVDFTKIALQSRPDDREVWTDALAGARFTCDSHAEADVECSRLDLIIVGGESGADARPFDVAWARQTVEQCKAAGISCFVKQMGRWIAGDETGFGTIQGYLLNDGGRFTPPVLVSRQFRPGNAIAFTLTDQKGGDPRDWPADIRVREMPVVAARPELRAGEGKG